MNLVLRNGLVVGGLAIWLGIRSTWTPAIILPALAAVAVLILALHSMAAGRRKATLALFWLFLGGTYISSAVEAYVFGLRNLNQTFFTLLTGAAVSYAVAAGTVWANRPRHEHVLERSYVSWRWSRALVSAVAFAVLYLLAGGLVFPMVRDFYAERVIPSLPVTVGLQVARGLIWVAVLFPWLKYVESRSRAVVALAVLAPVLGGVVPLALPNNYLPLSIRMWHMVEIVGSHVAFGLVAGYVLYRGSRVNVEVTVLGTLATPQRIDLADAVTAMSGDVEVILRPRRTR